MVMTPKPEAGGEFVKVVKFDSDTVVVCTWKDKLPFPLVRYNKELREEAQIYADVINASYRQAVRAEVGKVLEMAAYAVRGYSINGVIMSEEIRKLAQEILKEEGKCLTKTR